MMRLFDIRSAKGRARAWLWAGFGAVLLLALLALGLLFWPQGGPPADAGRSQVAPAQPDRQPAPAQDAPANTAQDPPWTRNLGRFVDRNGPLLAIVIDDIGRSTSADQRLLALGLPISVAILPDTPHPARSAAAFLDAGLDVLLHMPMEPQGQADPGQMALRSGQSAQEITRRVQAGFAKVPGAIGLNNHMGSRFTQDRPGMQAALAGPASQGLLFLDSRTSGQSVAADVARAQGMVTLERDVFLDDTIDEAAIAAQLARALAIARRKGVAIAIGHPHPQTLAVLERELPRLQGVQLAPLSALAARQTGR